MTIAIDDLRDVPALAREAEALGVDGLWTAETRHDPFLPLALAAEHTRRVSLGTAIAVAFPRSPTVVAHTAWDLQATLGRTPGPRSRHPGEGPHRAEVLRQVDCPGTAAPRVHPRPPGALGSVADPGAGERPGRALHDHAHDPVLRPGPDRAPAHPDLHRRGQRLQPPARRGALRGGAPASVPLGEVPAGLRPPEYRGGARKGRPEPGRRRAGMLGLHDHGPRRRGRRARPRARPSPNRVLRVDPDLRARAGRTRMGGPDAEAPPEVGGGRLGGHGGADHGRDAQGLRGGGAARRSPGRDRRALRRTARPDRAVRRARAPHIGRGPAAVRGRRSAADPERPRQRAVASAAALLDRLRSRACWPRRGRPPCSTPPGSGS